ncbi:MAG TPA: hypothetical protein VIZ18_14815 [Ktedonobacteraceae bacterium]
MAKISCGDPDTLLSYSFVVTRHEQQKEQRRASQQCQARQQAKAPCHETYDGG